MGLKNPYHNSEIQKVRKVKAMKAKDPVMRLRQAPLGEKWTETM